jgi:hypothetical protein
MFQHLSSRVCRFLFAASIYAIVCLDAAWAQPSLEGEPINYYTAATGPRDGRGRSLRDLDLKRRLFQYPCSYLIDSEAFDALPDPLRQYVYRQLWEIFTGRNTSETYSHLSPADRQAILEILRDTRPGLPDYWKTP